MMRLALLLVSLALPVQAQQGAILPVATVAPVIRAEIVEQIPVAGSLVPRNEVLVVPQVNGYPIEALLVDIGDKVAAGDVMARLDSRTLQAQVMQAEAELVRANAAVDQARSQIDSAAATADQTSTARTRSQTLLDNGTTTQALLDQAVAADLTAQAALRTARDGLRVAQAQVQQAQAARDIAMLNLGNATIRASVAGIVSARSGQVGAIAGSTGEPLFRLIEDGVIEVEAEVIETALGQVSAGDTAQMSVAGIGIVPGSVRRISPTVNAANRLGTIRISVDAEGLRTGLFASGWIVTTQRESSTVPTTAVLTDAEGDYVLKLDGDTLLRTPVTAGLIWNGRREVLDGLADGDIVVARAGAFFANGDRITPQEVE